MEATIYLFIGTIWATVIVLGPPLNGSSLRWMLLIGVMHQITWPLMIPVCAVLYALKRDTIFEKKDKD